jgi:hypothetical protein
MGPGFRGGGLSGGMHRAPPPGALGMAYRNNEPQEQQEARNSPNCEFAF